MGLFVASAVPAPFVPADSSAQLVPGRADLRQRLGDAPVAVEREHGAFRVEVGEDVVAEFHTSSKIVEMGAASRKPSSRARRSCNASGAIVTPGRLRCGLMW